MAAQGDHHPPDGSLTEARAKVAEGFAAIADGDVADGDIVFDELLTRRETGGSEDGARARLD